MTTNRAFKLAVRARMASSGETYQQASRALRALRAADLHDEPLESISTGSPLNLPDLDRLDGYGRTRGAEAIARQTWRDIATLASRSPNLALVLGAAVASLYVEPLRDYGARAFWMHLVGRSASGKTTALRAAAALVGDPNSVTTGGYGRTMRGFVGDLAALRCLPAFVTEPGIGHAHAHDREALILSISEGASRRVASRSGAAKIIRPWYGTVLSDGNDSLLDGIANQAVSARLIEIPAPITRSATDAEELAQLTRQAYGWPLRWIRESADLQRVRSSWTQAQRAFELPAGGAARVAARNLILAVVGAAELDHHLGTSILRAAALEASRAALDQLVAELSTPSELLRAAVVRRARSVGYRRLSEIQGPQSQDVGGVEGVVLDNSTSMPAGAIAILATALPAVAAEAGVTDVRHALRELAAMGVLLGGPERGQLSRRIRLGTQRAQVYVFRAPS